jgi:hypothetical protein
MSEHGSANLQGLRQRRRETLTSTTGINLLVGGAGDDTYLVRHLPAQN